MAERTGIAWVGELRPEAVGVEDIGVIPAGVKADNRLLGTELNDGLREEETEEFRRLDAAEPDRDRGGVSANAKMDLSNSGFISTGLLMA